MPERTFKVEKFTEIREAIEIVASNRFLDGTTSYKLGMMGDSIKSIINNFDKQRKRISLEARRQQKTILEGLTKETEKKINLEISTLMQKAQDEIDELLVQEESLKVPTLKLSEFIAKSDISDVFTSNGNSEAKVIIKSGQSLVPVKFFVLMGDLIQDDKNTD